MDQGDTIKSGRRTLCYDDPYQKQYWAQNASGTVDVFGIVAGLAWLGYFLLVAANSAINPVIPASSRSRLRQASKP